MRLLRMLAALLLAIAATSPVVAAPSTKERSYTHVMADTETRLDARRVAVQELQRQAAAEAATFVQGETRLDGERLAQSLLEVVSATVKVTVLSETPEVVDGRPALTVRAMTEVDHAVVQRRLEMLRTDDRLRQQLEQLAIDNARLEQEIDRLRLARESSQGGLTMENKERSVRARLTQGRTQAATLFVSTAPALSQAAIAHEIASEAFSAFEARFEEDVMTPLTAMPIKAELNRITLDIDPEFLRGTVSVRWDSFGLEFYACRSLNCGSCSTGPSLYFGQATDTSRCPIGISKRDTFAPRSAQLKSPAAASPMFRTLTARYLSSFDLVAVISIADQMAVLPVLAATDNALHGDQLGRHLEYIEEKTTEFDKPEPPLALTYLQNELNINIPVRFPVNLDTPLSIRLLRLPRPCDLKLPECNALRNFARTPSFVSIDTLQKAKSRW